MKNSKFAIGISFGLLVGGCTALESVKEVNSTGLPYYLPKGLVNLKIKVGSNNELSFQDAQVKTIPDRDYRYTLQYQPSAMSDDAIEVTTTNTGLLKEVKFTGDERSDEFIVKLAELGKEVFKAATFTPFGRVQDGLYEASFDPFSVSELAMLNSSIAHINPKFKIQFQASTEPPANYSQCEEINICFRTVSVFPLTLMNDNIEIQKIYIELPDRSRIGNIQVSRAAFVKKITNLTFDNGVLTKFDITKPSESIAAIHGIM